MLIDRINRLKLLVDSLNNCISEENLIEFRFSDLNLGFFEQEIINYNINLKNNKKIYYLDFYPSYNVIRSNKLYRGMNVSLVQSGKIYNGVICLVCKNNVYKIRIKNNYLFRTSNQIYPHTDRQTKLDRIIPTVIKPWIKLKLISLANHVRWRPNTTRYFSLKNTFNNNNNNNNNNK